MPFLPDTGKVPASQTERTRLVSWEGGRVPQKKHTELVIHQEWYLLTEILREAREMISKKDS